MNQDDLDTIRIQAQRSIDLYGGDDARAVIPSAKYTLAIIRAGEFRRPKWIDCPAHVPQGPALVELMKSTRAADKLQRIDAIDWRYRNELVETEAAARLEAIVYLFRQLDLVSREKGAESSVAHAMQRELVDHASNHFGGARVTRCPTDRAGALKWCRRHVVFDCPVPEWFRTRRRPPETFEPRDGEPTPIGGLWS